MTRDYVGFGWRRGFPLLAAAILSGGLVAAERVGVPGVPWPATDALGRSLPVGPELVPIRADRFVGIFYFLWHDKSCPRSPALEGPYDLAKIMARDPEALKKPDSPLWGPIGTSHYWGEPLYGYYSSVDRWVLRRHAQLLADAGIDTLIFDTTNGPIYSEAWRALAEVFREVRQSGGRTPQFAFMVNTAARDTALRIYNELYAPGHFRELWFQWQGKPLLICDPAEATPELREFFTLRRAHWPFTMTNTARAWHWEATFPQPYGYVDDPAQPEQVNVSVAQNLDQESGTPVNMSQGRARGRGYSGGRNHSTPEALNRGLNFHEQWTRAFDLQPPFVMVTGWNEWIAGRWGKPEGPFFFVDQFDREFSRDIEPMLGGHGDNYYWQMVANIRRYKGAPAIPAASGARTIRIPGSFDQWQEVGPEYRDHAGETLPRDCAGAGGLTYTRPAGRNDLLAFKVSHDPENLFFYAKSVGELSTADGTNWMWLLLDVDQNTATGWQGYDFMVNRVAGATKGQAQLEKNRGGWSWEPAGSVAMEVKGNELQLAISRKSLGLVHNKKPLRLDFKWADDLARPGEVMDFYLSGDVAPEGRFNYRYETSGN